MKHILSKKNLILMLPALLLVFAAPTFAASAKGKVFASPDQAVQALVAAVRGGNREAVMTVLGPGSEELVSSGDAVIDRDSRDRFLTSYDKKHRIQKGKAGKAVLFLGQEGYPFPIPVVKKGKGWVFDTAAGREEILNRRIGRDELAVIDVLRAYTVAQREYASRDANRNGIKDFAQKIRSTPGKQDGLYWEAAEGEQESPLGPLAAEASSEGYAKPESEAPVPFHGYYYKILTAQGEHAVGGAYDYVVNGNMVLGFAMVAYPAQYGSSGIMTFVVNQSGVVYQKNLGKNTAEAASSMKRYDPDKSWKKVE